MKRWLHTVGALALTLGLVLAGCQKAPEKAAENATSGAAGELKVGFVYTSPVGEAGYSWAQDQGRKALEKLGVKTEFVESVKEGADAERVIENMEQMPQTRSTIWIIWL